MTPVGLSSTVRDMPARTNDPYDPEAIRAHILKFMEARGLKTRPWAEAAEVSEGSLRSFLGVTKGGQPLENPTESPLLSLFVRLAHAANVTVSELIGEAAPAPASALQGQPSPERQLKLEQMIHENQQQILELYRRQKTLLEKISSSE